MKRIIIFLSLLVLFISIGAVSADGNLIALEAQIDSSTSSIEIDQDYSYSPTDDGNYTIGVNVGKANFVINGNGHTIDGKNQSRLFRIYNENVTVNNLIIKNGFSSDYGGGILSLGNGLVLNNVTFINDMAATKGGALVTTSNASVNDCKFIDNYAPEASAIFNENTYMNVNNSYFQSSKMFEKAMVYGYLAVFDIDNCLFINTTSKYAPAIYNDRKTYISNSQFINLNATMSAGAIHIKELDELIINGCSFINTTSTKNAGAVFVDTEGFTYTDNGTTLINNTEFLNCSSEFGGALIILCGRNAIIQSTFKDNSARYNGGAIYLSWGTYNIENTLIENNKLTDDEDFIHGGGIYADLCTLTAVNNHFINNTKHGLYSYDCDLNITQSLFRNNGEAIHAVFLGNYSLDNIYDGDTDCLNDTDYKTIVSEKVEKLVLTNDTIIFSKLPKTFDLRDWYWVSPVKNQGSMNSCWAFGTTGAMESALIKYSDIEYKFSENNVQNSLLKYSKFGCTDMSEGSDGISHIVYAINWLGMLNTIDDEYDSVGKISQFLSNPQNVHIQDAIIVNARNNSTDNTAIKEAILKYCGLTACVYSTTDPLYYNKNTSALYYYGDNATNHVILIVGWDDTYSAKNFAKTPPGDGAWIIKNSYGTEFGDEGYNYVSYYDTMIGMDSDLVGYIFENDVQYTKNYQTDLGGQIKYYQSENEGANSSYKNTYEAIEDDLIAAVGTYFCEAGEAYTLEIIVNNNTKLTQSGTAPFRGYHTIKLNKYIPILEGDNFTVEMTKKYVPILEKSRQNFENNTSFANYGRGYYDLVTEDSTASLKVYTVDEVILTEDLVKIYKNDSQFEAKIGAPNQIVTFEIINGGLYNRTSDAEGIAKMNINLNPGNYTIKTTFNGTTVENTITVLPTLIANNLVKYFRNASQFIIELVDGQGKPVSGKNITMNINGVFYNRVTDENGIAKLNINLEPNKYILTAIDSITGLQMSYTITVLPTLIAEDLNMKYLDGSKFEAKLVDGTGKALANKKITFNINGVFYQRTTDVNGIANLNIRLMAGQYIITSQYESATISNKITITA